MKFAAQLPGVEASTAGEAFVDDVWAPSCQVCGAHMPLEPRSACLRFGSASCLLPWVACLFILVRGARHSSLPSCALGLSCTVCVCADLCRGDARRQLPQVAHRLGQHQRRCQLHTAGALGVGSSQLLAILPQFCHRAHAQGCIATCLSALVLFETARTLVLSIRNWLLCRLSDEKLATCLADAERLLLCSVLCKWTPKAKKERWLQVRAAMVAVVGAVAVIAVVAVVTVVGIVAVNSRSVTGSKRCCTTCATSCRCWPIWTAAAIPRTKNCNRAAKL